jgi:hypothetical protein
LDWGEHLAVGKEVMAYSVTEVAKRLGIWKGGSTILEAVLSK